jgi:hypothetical protein
MTTRFAYVLIRSLKQISDQEKLCQSPITKTEVHRIVLTRLVHTRRCITERSLPERCSLAWHGTDKPNVEAQHKTMIAAERIVKTPPPRYIIMPIIIA